MRKEMTSDARCQMQEDEGGAWTIPAPISWDIDERVNRVCTSHKLNLAFHEERR